MKDSLKEAMMNRRKGIHGLKITIGPDSDIEMNKRMEEGKTPWKNEEDGMAPRKEDGIDMYKAESELDLGKNDPGGGTGVLDEREKERAEMLSKSGEVPKSLEDKALLEKYKKTNKES
jgi:hypothetical protein